MLATANIVTIYYKGGNDVVLRYGMVIKEAEMGRFLSTKR